MKKNINEPGYCVDCFELGRVDGYYRSRKTADEMLDYWRSVFPEYRFKVTDEYFGYLLDSMCINRSPEYYQRMNSTSETAVRSKT